MRFRKYTKKTAFWPFAVLILLLALYIFWLPNSGYMNNDTEAGFVAGLIAAITIIISILSVVHYQKKMKEEMETISGTKINGL